MTVSNCNLCHKVFAKGFSELCPECFQTSHQKFTKLYRVLQDSAAFGGISIKELSKQVGYSESEIENFYKSGRLGTAATFLKVQCANCKKLTNYGQRRGHFCLVCSEKMARQAGVEIKSRKKVLKEEEVLKQKETYQVTLSGRSNESSSSSSCHVHCATGIKVEKSVEPFGMMKKNSSVQ
jgi:hypothetical protein